MPRRKTVLDSRGLSARARATLPSDVQQRVAEAWGRGRALILNANKTSYSEAFTISSEQYAALRDAILGELPPGEEVQLKRIVATVQIGLGRDKLFPGGRMTNFVRYVKTDLEARGEIARIEKSSPQRLIRL